MTDVKVLLEARIREAAVPVDPDDPQKGRWGGSASRSGRELSATARELSPGWFEVTLVVRTITGAPLSGKVQFHLHPTFAKPVVTVEAADGQATLTLTSYGAFTVGAVADEGRTVLEIDLSTVESLPREFRDYR